MDDHEVLRQIDELDRAFSREKAELLIYCEDIETRTCELIGNRNGFLRAGVEFLKAAVLPLAPNESILPFKLDYLVRNSRSLLIARLTRQEDVDAALPPLKQKGWKNKAVGFGCLTVVIFLVVCTFIGVGQLFVWIFGK